MRGGSPCSSSQGVCSWTGGVYVLGFHELWHNGEVAVWRDSTRGGVCWGGPHPLHTLVLPVHLSVSTVHCHGSPSSTAAAVAALHEQPGRIQESRCTLHVSEQRRGGETPALTGTTQRRSTPSRLVSLCIDPRDTGSVALVSSWCWISCEQPSYNHTLSIQLCGEGATPATHRLAGVSPTISAV